MINIKPLLHVCNRDVGRDGDPYLRIDGFLRAAVKSLDAKLLFDPFKKTTPLATVACKERTS